MSKNKDNTMDDLKRKLILLVGGITAFVIVIIIILWIVSLFAKPVYSYENIEKELVNSAKKYFNDHQENLPQSDGQIVELDYSNLVAEGYMKDLSEYTKKGVTCSAVVQVEKQGNDYLYTPFLNCVGENETYETKLLYQEITKPENIVTADAGLYNQGGTYVFRGEEVKNYLQLDQRLWRIMKITPNNNVVITTDEVVGDTMCYDDRFNNEDGYDSGINDYRLSRLRSNLIKYFDSEKEGEKFLSSDDKTKLVTFSQCSGKRGINETGYDGTIECKEIVKDEKVGLITASEFIRASLDPNCKSIATKSCNNYNYLVLKNPYWLATPAKDTTQKVYYLNERRVLAETIAITYAYMRPVVYLNDRLVYKDGDGSYEHPYTLR